MPFGKPNKLVILHHEEGDAGTPFPFPPTADTDGGAIGSDGVSARSRLWEISIVRSDGNTTPQTLAGTNLLVYAFIPGATAHGDSTVSTPDRWIEFITVKSARDDDNLVTPYQQQILVPVDATRLSIAFFDTSAGTQVNHPNELTVTARENLES